MKKIIEHFKNLKLIDWTALIVGLTGAAIMLLDCGIDNYAR